MVGSLAEEHPGLVRLQAAAVLAVVVAAHLSLVPRLASVDAFYHLGHAAQYRHAGLFDTSFPWATASIIGDLGGDLWWGFHMVLLPFTWFSNVTDGIRVAGLVFTLVLAATVWWTLRRHSVSGAGWWTVVFLVAVPNVLYRYLMVRPHVLSLALAILLLSFLSRGRRWQVLVLSAGITWLHLSLFWMAPGIVVAYALAGILGGHAEGSGGRGGTRAAGVGVGPALAAVLAGTALGALLRPHPVATAELAWVQIVRLFAEKATDKPLVFATELLPLPAAELLRSAGPFLAVLAAAAVAAWIGRRRAADSEPGSTPASPERRLLLTAVLVSAAFLVLAVFSARRALVEFVAFGFLILPLTWSAFVPTPVRRRALPVVGLLFALHLAWVGQRHMLNARLVAVAPDLMREAATWLAGNTTPGDIVFHAHWDDFGPLFAYDRNNRFLGGMDPIFQFAHDPGLYWEHFYLSGDLVVEYTCDAFPCYEGNATPTAEAIRDHFGARWVLVEPVRNPKLTAFLLGDPGFEKVLETRREMVFRVVEPDAAPSLDARTE
jgi:hypothetical protein